MPVKSRKEFIACVTKSKAIPAKAFEQWLEVIEDEDPLKISAKLVRDKLLTPWQAKFLVSGRSRLTVGNYLLQSRTSNDELGDKFIAVHSSLKRKVVIQVFPSAIAEDEQLLKRLLKKLRQITELDHPNLVHVYDVDQESERFFLVTEYVEGRSLDTVSPREFGETEIAVLVQELAAGLSCAHESDIVHGDVSTENIILTPEGKAKLEGFASATLTAQIDATTNRQSTHGDFRQLAKIGIRLLKELPQSARSDQYSTVGRLIGDIGKSKTPSSRIELLGEWITENVEVDEESVEGVESDSGPSTEADDFFISPSSDSGELDASSGASSSRSASQTAEQSTDESAAESKSNNFLAKLWREQRPAFFAFATALLLAVGCVIGLLVFALSPGAEEEVSPNPPNTLAKNTSQAQPTSTPTTKRAEGALASGQDDESTDDPLDPEANRRKLAEFYANRDGKAPTKNADAAKPQDAPSKDKVAGGTTAGGGKDAESDPEETEASIKPKAPPTRTSNTDLADGATETDKPQEEAEAEPKKEIVKEKRKPKPARIVNPFKSFAKRIDLPEFTDTEDLKIGDLVISKNQLLGLNLISGPEISRSKIQFVTSRSPDDDQSWNVQFAPKRGEPVEVAQFQKTPTEMKFRWLPAAAENEDANYLRNCLIKLSTSSKSTVIALRQPVAIEGLQFDEESSLVKTEIELDWLPDVKSVQVELKDFETGRKFDQVTLNPAIITKRAPGKIFFRSAEEERLFFINVSTDVRKKMRFTAQMAFALPNGPQPLRTRAELNDFVNRVEGQKTNAFKILQQSKTTKRPNDIPKEEFDKMKTDAAVNAERLSEFLTLAVESLETAKQLEAKEIPVSVFYEMDGERIVLAETLTEK